MIEGAPARINCKDINQYLLQWNTALWCYLFMQNRIDWATDSYWDNIRSSRKVCHPLRIDSYNKLFLLACVGWFCLLGIAPGYALPQKTTPLCKAHKTRFLQFRKEIKMCRNATQNVGGRTEMLEIIDLTRISCQNTRVVSRRRCPWISHRAYRYYTCCMIATSSRDEVRLKFSVLK